MAPKHSRGRSGPTCKVSVLRKMSHYAKQPDCYLAELGARPNFAANGTKALPGSVRAHMQSFGAAQNVTLC